MTQLSVWILTAVLLVGGQRALENAGATTANKCDLLRRGDYCTLRDESLISVKKFNSLPMTNRENQSVGNNKIEVKIGAILIYKGEFDDAVWLTEILISLALADIECSNFLRRYKIRLISDNDGCAPAVGVRSFVNLFNIEAVGFIGPACSVTAEAVGRITPYLNMPLVLPAAEAVELSDRKVFQNVYRLSASGKLFATGWKSLMRYFKWKEVAVLIESGHEFDEFVRMFENSLIQEEDVEITLSLTISSVDFNAITVLKAIEDANSRLVVAMVYPSVARKLLCEAIKKKLTSCCEGSQKINFIWPSWFQPQEWLVVKENETDGCTTNDLMQAATGSLVVSSQPFGDDKQFLDNMEKPMTVCEWKERLYEAVTNTRKMCIHPDDDGKSNWVSTYLGNYYDSVWVWAKALRALEDLPGNVNLTDIYKPNSELRRKILPAVLQNVSFNGASGHVVFDGTNRIARGLVYNNQRRCLENHKNCHGTCQTKFRELAGTPYRIVGSLMDNGTLNLNESRISWGYSNCTTQTCPRPSNKLYAETDSGENCGALRSLASSAGSCAAAVAIVSSIVLTFGVTFLVIILWRFLKHRYRSRYLEESLGRLKQLGLVSNEAYCQLELDPRWEIDRNKIVINRKLGEGAFGAVYGADAFDVVEDTPCTPVAIKTLSENPDPNDQVAFLAEIQLMKCFKHSNIVELIGVCTAEPPLYMAMELMLHGDLKNFLLSHRHLTSGSEQLTSHRMTSMARDIAKGLEYLHSVNHIHRDMAARNCMVTTNFTVKIGDFGMSRKVDISEYYRVQKAALLPVRWMARESLMDGIFTQSTDVWSFAVVVWEMITFGAMPYTAMSNQDVIDHVRMGKTLFLPSQCKEKLATFLLLCWDLTPEQRPTAADIVLRLTNQPELITPCPDLLLQRASQVDQESREWDDAFEPRYVNQQKATKAPAKKAMRNHLFADFLGSDLAAQRSGFDLDSKSMPNLW